MKMCNKLYKFKENFPLLFTVKKILDHFNFIDI